MVQKRIKDKGIIMQTDISNVPDGYYYVDRWITHGAMQVERNAEDEIVVYGVQLDDDGGKNSLKQWERQQLGKQCTAATAYIPPLATAYEPLLIYRGFCGQEMRVIVTDPEKYGREFECRTARCSICCVSVLSHAFDDCGHFPRIL